MADVDSAAENDSFLTGSFIDNMFYPEDSLFKMVEGKKNPNMQFFFAYKSFTIYKKNELSFFGEISNELFQFDTLSVVTFLYNYSFSDFQRNFSTTVASIFVELEYWYFHHLSFAFFFVIVSFRFYNTLFRI